MSDDSPEIRPAAPFHAVLTPHRSLTPRAFVILMAAFGAVNFAIGVLFYSIGAWPVLGFCGLDVLLLYGMFRLNYRSARISETVALASHELQVSRILPSGRSTRWRFNPDWVRVELRELAGDVCELNLHSHGRRLVIGGFLSDSERRDFAQALRRALMLQRGQRV